MAATSARTKTAAKNVLELADLYKSGKTLQEESWGSFHRIFKVTSATGKMMTPKDFDAKLVKWFHRPGDSAPEESIKRAREQTVVRIFDRWSCNQTCFNAARACKPFNVRDGPSSLHREMSHTDGPVEGCDFCQPLNFTAEDLFGRLENESTLTASNVAKYDALHTMIIFKEHPPSHITKTKVFDMFEIAKQWFDIAHERHPNFIYPIISWNCRSRAGASQHHGHAHMCLAEEFHYGHWERLKQVSQLYAKEYPGQNYFDDFVEAHRVVNLAQPVGDAWMLVHLVPYCGYELKVICWDLTEDFKRAVYKAVNILVNEFKSQCFNVCIQFPPLQNGNLRPPTGSPKRMKLDGPNGGQMPFIAHLVDRGDINKGTSSDVCSMRIYGSAIVNEDPLILAQRLGWF